MTSNFDDMDKLARELKEDKEENWKEVSRSHESIKALRESADQLVGRIAEDYILKMLPELSKIYGRSYVCGFEVFNLLKAYESRFHGEKGIINGALENLVDSGKLTRLEVEDMGSQIPAYQIKEGN